MSKKFVRVSVQDVRSYWSCANKECEDYNRATVCVTPEWHSDNGTPVCDKCDTDMHFDHVEVAQDNRQSKQKKQNEKAERKLRDSIAFYERRKAVADSLYSTADRAILEIPEETEVIESEGWETEGENRLMQKFYYGNPASNEDSKVGTFIVDFKPKSDKVADVHSNT